MKNWGKRAAIGIISLLGVAASGFAALGQDAFFLNRDGRLESADRQFANFGQFVLSDYFREQGRRCGTRTPAPAPDDWMARAVSDCTMQLTVINNEYWPDYVFTLPVWFHVIHRADGTGNIPEQRIKDQIAVLNEDFRALAGTMGEQGADSRIQFSLAGISRTENNAWYDDGLRYETAYKLGLNKDPLRYVNIYSVFFSDGTLGMATFPQHSAGQYLDGIVMNSEAVGGRDNGLPLYDQGRTLVHEMGHYLGLLHTFEGGTCGNSYSGGDLVVDTAAEDRPHHGCTPTFTCGSPDPVDNYMNYTDDACMRRFTREQNNRAVCGLVNYRPLLYQVSGPADPADQLPSGSYPGQLPSFLFPLLLRGR